MNVNRGKVPLWITLLTFVGLAAAVALWITSADPPRAMAQDEMPTLVTAPRPDVLASEAQAYPPDPPHDIPWDINANALTVDDVRTVFNRARAAENAALGTFLGEINLPTMAVWRTMDDGARALWLINEERTARNLPRLHGIERSNASTPIQRSTPVTMSWVSLKISRRPAPPAPTVSRCRWKGRSSVGCTTMRSTAGCIAMPSCGRRMRRTAARPTAKGSWASATPMAATWGIRKAT